MSENLPGLDPTPDEEAWEKYLEFALERLGADGSNGMTNATLGILERALGGQLPFEIGLLLVMGVHDDEGWHQWGDDPASELADWNESLLHGILFDVEQRDVWAEAWGARPSTPPARADVVSAAFQQATPLLPLYRDRAVPVGLAVGEEASESNPVLIVRNGEVAIDGYDLAAWLHKQFDVPLPMWPETPERQFEFWSDLVN